MARPALSLWLIVTILVGPMLCCCATAAVAGEPVIKVAPRPTSEMHRRKSCCESASNPVREDSKQPTPKGCPCRQQQAERQPAISSPNSDEVRPAGQRLALELLPADPSSRAATWSVPARIECRPREEAFVRSGRAILTAHHVLTC